MIILGIILIVVSLITTSFLIWALIRLNRYIAGLERQIENQLERIEEVEELLLQANLKNKKVVRKNLIPTEE